MRPVPTVILGVLLTLSLTGCSTLQETADDEAARIADGPVPSALTDAVAAATTPEERGVAAQAWLTDPYGTLEGGYGPTAWALRGGEGTTLRVDVYHWSESGDLLPLSGGSALAGRYLSGGAEDANPWPLLTSPGVLVMVQWARRT